MLKPLPCPFCGELPTILPVNPKKEGNAWGAVQCMNEDCQARPFVDDGESWSDDRGSNAYKESAIKRWNKRA